MKPWLRYNLNSSSDALIKFQVNGKNVLNSLLIVSECSTGSLYGVTVFLLTMKPWLRYNLNSSSDALIKFQVNEKNVLNNLLIVS